MTRNELNRICGDIDAGESWVACGGGHLIGEIFGQDVYDPLWLQVQYHEADIYTKEVEIQKGRRWLIEEDATVEQVLQTILKALLTSAEHRIRERFLYRNVRIFGPHPSLDDLMEMAGRKEARRRND